MKKVLVVMILFCVFFKTFADDDKLKLVIMEIEDLSNEIEPDVLTNATEHIRGSFIGTNRYLIIAKDRQKDAISDIRKKFNTDPRYKSCTDKGCQIQLGQALSADFVVKTTISSLGEFYRIRSAFIDLEKEVEIYGAHEDYDGSARALSEAIDKVVIKIVENEKMVSACETAKEANSIREWQNYADRYPNGECINEAHKQLDELNCAAAEESQSIKVWKIYLKDFPEGKCEQIAKSEIKKLEDKEKSKEEKEQDARDCENAVKAREIHIWNNYLQNHPYGECVEEAKEQIKKIKEEEKIRKSKENVTKKDLKDCKSAQKENKISSWKTYLRKHPDGECADEAKEKIDELNCAAAKESGTIKAWEKYLKEFPKGECAYNAVEEIKKIREKINDEKYEKEVKELELVHSEADDKMSGIFHGQYDAGIIGVFDGYNKFGFSTGFDFNFNVYKKEYGLGAGNLFVGFGFDFEWYLPTAERRVPSSKSESSGFEENSETSEETQTTSYTKTKTHLLEIPIMANLGYYFRTTNYTLRYVGFWFSGGVGIDFLLWSDLSDWEEKTKSKIYTSFAWEFGFNMIYRSDFTMNFGVGGFTGDAYKYIDGIHLFFNLGTVL